MSYRGKITFLFALYAIGHPDSPAVWDILQQFNRASDWNRPALWGRSMDQIF
jgi:hypothetical protein